MLLAGSTSSGLLFVVSTISNYDKQGISQNYTEGLPEFATVNGLESNLGDIPSGIRLNKTQIYLDCSSDFMNITLTFMEKFYGIVYADYNSENNDYDRTCRINGDGHIKRELILSLKGCGTVQVSHSFFMVFSPAAKKK
ncbi:Uncharacterized protein FKW44_000189 [Caligus rogercresseyi]|uniref:ZP domain-containing protein n=1 Tax=Caligus rogercresseyi TaxID=217165 RepID=A0A7T8QUP8_CALRO|nr:Uncharacterized protein FKW44_000189 [Caligus rogercresseyi]